MSLDISNIELNLIRKGLKTLESAYKQSNDNRVLNSVKERVYFDLCATIDGFEELFDESFKSCKMLNIAQIDELASSIYSRVNVEKMPQIDYAKAKKIFKKLSEKSLGVVIRNYNKLASKTPLTYYSQEIDDKMVFLFFDKTDGFTGSVCSITKSSKILDSACHFCNTIRVGSEIVFVSNPSVSKDGQYKSWGVFACNDHSLCNSDIIDDEKLLTFINYGRIKNERNGQKSR